MEETKYIIKDNQNKKNTGLFWGGMLTGVIIALVIVVVILLVSRITKTLYLADTVEEQTQESAILLSDKISNKLETLNEAILEFSIYDATDDQMASGIYQGLVDSLEDPYSDYYTEEELNAFMDSSEGIYYGIGAYIGYDSSLEYPVFSKIMDGTPAEEAGFMEGDVIFEVDGVSAFQMDTSEVVTLIKGPENTSVLVTVYREAAESPYIDIEVTRAQIESPTVNYEMLDNNVGYMEIVEFDDVTVEQFEAAKTALEAENMQGLIIDLRSNPGGNLSAVVAIARSLMPEGLIVYTEDKNGVREEYSCDGNNQIQIPLVVLTNQYSASAAEILAGAVKDSGIGTLVGMTTFGKGIVQRIFPLTDGSAIKLTVSKYYTPNGINIHGVGIQPDVEIELDSEAYLEDGTDSQLQKGIEVMNELLAEE